MKSKARTPVPTLRDSKDIQLSLFPDSPLFEKPAKPQVASIPGIRLTEEKRYRIVLEGKVLHDRLTSDQALEILGKGKKDKRVKPNSSHFNH